MINQDDPGGLALGFIVFVFGMMVAFYISDKMWRDTIIKKDLAEYYLDENNDRQWRWK